MKPFSPQEAEESRQTRIPDEVIDAFNFLISKNLSGQSARVVQDEVVDMIVQNTGVPRNLIFDQGWLNVEKMYGAVGWDVKYDSPSYDESFPAYFKFTKKKS